MKKTILFVSLCFFLNPNSYAQSNSQAQIKNEIINILDRSRPIEQAGTKYSFKGCTLVEDQTDTEWARDDCDFSGTDFRYIAEFDISKIIMNGRPEHKSLGASCDGNSECITFLSHGRLFCELKGRPYEIKSNGGGISVKNPSDVRRLEGLFYELRESCN